MYYFDTAHSIVRLTLVVLPLVTFICAGATINHVKQIQDGRRRKNSHRNPAYATAASLFLLTVFMAIDVEMTWAHLNEVAIQNVVAMMFAAFVPAVLAVVPASVALVDYRDIAPHP